jgi:hypothetical protein
LLKQVQSNLNTLLKEYDLISNSSELNEKIKQIEQENLELSQKLIELEQNKPPPTARTNDFFNGDKENYPFSNQQSNDFFAASVTVTPTLIEDPFKKFDPFNVNGGGGGTVGVGGNDDLDPFKAISITQQSTVSDPFSSSDPFSTPPSNFPTSNNNTIGGFDPFDAPLKSSLDALKKENGVDVKKSNGAPPARPAPPRPQTPNFQATKNSNETLLLAERPQSSLDFTLAKKMDLFKDFNDPFTSLNIQKSTVTSTTTNTDTFDPFGMASSNSSQAQSQSNGFASFDPFA